MAFTLSDEQELIQRTVRELAEKEIGPRAKEADLEERFPRDNVAAIAALGLLGVTLSPEEGGAGADTVALALACEELAAECATTGTFVAITNAWLSVPLAKHATESVRAEWLPRILQGEALGTYGLHEDSVGSDPFRIRTSARPHETPEDPTNDAAPATLSGTKDLTFLVGEADLTLVVARRLGGTTERRVDIYAVPGARDGVQWGSDESKIGLRGYPAGPLYLTNVQVGPEDLVGAPGQAPEIVRRATQLASIGTSACAVGLSRAALEASVEFANQREQFGHTIANYQAIQHYIADMRIRTDAARNLVLAAAARLDQDGEASVAVEEANAAAFDAARHVTKLAIRTHGGAGFMRDLPVERFARDVRALSAFGRSPDVSKTIVGVQTLEA
ncbi:MAG: acyl-CoA dehydrogenase family protein [Euryarchaeota archaeon]|nr:acyl-CoA dehydrogenase family protein [Euryarchaeota archaeon]